MQIFPDCELVAGRVRKEQISNADGHLESLLRIHPCKTSLKVICRHEFLLPQDHKGYLPAWIFQTYPRHAGKALL